MGCAHKSLVRSRIRSHEHLQSRRGILIDRQPCQVELFLLRQRRLAEVIRVARRGRERAGEAFGVDRLRLPIGEDRVGRRGHPLGSPHLVSM